MKRIELLPPTLQLSLANPDDVQNANEALTLSPDTNSNFNTNPPVTPTSAEVLSWNEIPHDFSKFDALLRYLSDNTTGNPDSSNEADQDQTNKLGFTNRNTNFGLDNFQFTSFEPTSSLLSSNRIDQREGEDTTVIVEYNYDDANTNTNTNTDTNDTNTNSSSTNTTILNHVILIKFKNPLPVPLTKVTVRIYGVGVVSGIRGSQTFSVRDVPANSTVAWAVNVTVIRQLEPGSPSTNSTTNTNANTNSNPNTNTNTNTDTNADVNTINNVISQPNTNSSREGKTEGKPVFVVVNSEEISRMDAYIIL